MSMSIQNKHLLKVGLYPMAYRAFSAHAHQMKPHEFSASQIQKTAIVLNPVSVGPRPQSGNRAKHWLEAEAQSFGGIGRETQMRRGSSLFRTEL
ncbi:MAG: hypothetical protein ABSE48_03835 [Verrucomicrobiota bacterium]|jgi:hypothetical protein